MMSKMGISTIQSYRGAQIFEAVGISADVIERYFSGTASQLSGIEFRNYRRRSVDSSSGRLQQILMIRRLKAAVIFNGEKQGNIMLSTPKRFIHCNGPAEKVITVYLSNIQTWRMKRDSVFYVIYSRLIKSAKASPIDEVESVESIVSRFKTGAMSFGSLSQEAHETLAIAMNRLGGKSNSGEGGEHPAVINWMKTVIIAAAGLSKLRQAVLV